MINVIIPCYNDGEHLREALDSLVQQNKRNFITTVVDDCSTDNIETVVKLYTDKLSIIYLRTPHNGGPGFARQYALDNMDKKIDYVMFLDSDDVLLPQATEILGKEMGITGADMIVSNFIVEGNPQLKEEVVLYTLDKNKTWLHGKIYRTEFLREYDIRFPPVRVNEDVGFNVQTYSLAKKHAYLNQATYCYSYNEKSLTHSTEDLPFILKHNRDFIVSLVYGIMHVYKYKERDKHFDQLVALCMRQFHILFEMARYYWCDFEVIAAQLDWFFNAPIIQRKIQEKDFFYYLAYYSTFHIDTHDVIVFPERSFMEFLNCFVKLPNYKIPLKLDLQEVERNEPNAVPNK